MPPYSPSSLASLLPFLAQAGGARIQPRKPAATTTANVVSNPMPPMDQQGMQPPQQPLPPGGNMTDNPLGFQDPGMIQPQMGGPSMASMAGDPHIPGPKLFSKGGPWVNAFAAFADSLAEQNGGHAIATPMIEDMKQREFDREKWNQERMAKQEEAMRPHVEQVGSTLGMLDPSAQSYKPFYTAPQPFESYASAQGYQPGSPEYGQAVQDYRMGSWSDPAVENRTALEGVRYGYRDQLQDQRLSVTRRGQDLSHGDRQRGQALIDSRTRRGQDMTDSRVRGSAAYQGRSHGGSGGNGGAGAGARAVGPNGHAIVVRNGQWVDEATGHPVN